MARGLLAWLVQPRRVPGRRGRLSWDLQKEEELLCEVGEEHCRLWVAESLAYFRTYRWPPWGRAVMGDHSSLGAKLQAAYCVPYVFLPVQLKSRWQNISFM